MNVFLTVLNYFPGAFLKRAEMLCGGMLTLHCSATGKQFVVDDADLAFYERVSPRIGDKTFSIPPPRLCPEARLKRRLSHRNQIYLFTRPSSSNGETIFSIYPKDSPLKVVANDEWWSDSWDALDYGRGFDFSEEFFPQFEKLRNQVPFPGRLGVSLDNSEYCSNASCLKNCYVVFNTSYAEDCMYCENAWKSKNCIDCTHTKYSELCYDCVNCEHCYSLQSSEDCANCSNSCFLLNCIGCKNCFGCVNLRHGEYCFFNKRVSRKEYEEFLSGLNLSSYSAREKLRRDVTKFWREQPRPHARVRFAEDVSGDHIVESQAVHDSYFIGQGENLRYCFLMYDGSRDCRDCTIPGIKCERVYEGLQCGINSYDIAFGIFCADGSSRVYYSQHCVGCRDCFACVGLKRKQYCLFNTQYSEEDYCSLVPRVIEQMRNTKEWGEFFPSSSSPVPYNYSLANRYFPLSKQEIQEQGLYWLNAPAPKAGVAVSAEELPDVPPKGKQPIVAESSISGRVFKITAREIDLLRQLGAPLPRVTYDERMELRAKSLGGISLYRRECAKTSKEILTTYPPNTPWIIWHRDAYEREFSS